MSGRQWGSDHMEKSRPDQLLAWGRQLWIGYLRKQRVSLIMTSQLLLTANELVIYWVFICFRAAGVYTRVTKVMPWIVATIQDGECANIQARAQLYP